MIAWTGWSLPAVLALFAGVGAVVTGLYFLKLRRRPVRVPFLPLWDELVVDERRTRLFDQLKRWLSLLLALMVVAALAFAVGDPRAAGAGDDGRTIVLLVDASASMRATDVSPSRFERARGEARRLVDDLGPRDRMLVAELTDTVDPRSPLTGELSVLRDGVDALRSHAAGARLDRGLAFASDVLRGASRPEVVVITDGRPTVGAVDSGEAPAEGAPDGGDPAPSTAPLGQRARALLDDERVRFSWVRVGREDAANVAITAFSVRRYPLDKSQTEVLLEVWNPTEGPRDVELQLASEAGPVEVERLTVPARERVRRFFRNVSGADRTLEASIGPVADTDANPDALSVDDRAFARVPARRRARVLVVTEGNLYLEAALLLDAYLDVTEIRPPSYPVEGDYDVVIFDRVLPDAAPREHAIYLGPEPRPGGVAPVTLTDEIVERPYFDRVDKDHPLTRFAALGDVNVAETRRVEPRDGDDVVAADRSGPPLLVSGRRNGRGFVLLPFDLSRSDLPLRVAWPLLLLHAIDLFVEEAGGFHSSFATGRVWRIPVPAEATHAEILPPGADPREGRQVPVQDAEAVYRGTEVGFHRLVPRSDPGNGSPVTPLPEVLVAANLGPGEEADLAAAATLEVGGRPAEAPSRGAPGARRRPWVWLVLLALTIVVAEWWTYHRRWTV